MILTTLGCATLKAMLDDSLKALHNLRTGRMARVIVDQNGERVEFTAANSTQLISYINQIETAMAAAGCTSAANLPVSNGPIGFIF